MRASPAEATSRLADDRDALLTRGDLMLLRPEQAAEKLSIGRSKLYELLAADEIESVRIGKLRRIPVDALDEYVARLRKEQLPAANGVARLPVSPSAKLPTGGMT